MSMSMIGWLHEDQSKPTIPNTSSHGCVARSVRVYSTYKEKEKEKRCTMHVKDIPVATPTFKAVSISSADGSLAACARRRCCSSITAKYNDVRV